MSNITYWDKNQRQNSADYAKEFYPEFPDIRESPNTGQLFQPNEDFVKKLEAAGRKMFSGGYAVMPGVRRTIGVYHYGTAEGRLEKRNITGSKDGSGHGYSLELTFYKLSDAQVLHDLVFTGKIRPTASFEDAQTQFYFPSWLEPDERILAKLITENVSTLDISKQLSLSIPIARRKERELLYRFGTPDRISLILHLLNQPK
jgi:hypothetical protein